MSVRVAELREILAATFARRYSKVLEFYPEEEFPEGIPEGI